MSARAPRIKTRYFLTVAFLGFGVALDPDVGILTAQEKKPTQSAANKANQALPIGVITEAMWRGASREALRQGEIDELIAKELSKCNLPLAPRTSDAQFIRRVMLDLTGRLPLPAEVAEFVNDRDANKRGKLIDKLLDSDAYVEHWAHYWRRVIGSRITDFRGNIMAPAFETWMREQLRANKSWAEICRILLTADGEFRFNEPLKNGELFFLAPHIGVDASVERAAETSRVFLGIQIQCAQCHDHPTDVWKQKQFHEFTAFFARAKSRPIVENKKQAGTKFTSAPFGEHRLPNKDFPKKGTVVRPRFLNGSAPEGWNLDDARRRRFLTDQIVSKDNPWFAAAFVNRMWGEFMGQSFYQPIDDMGPMKDAVFPAVIARLSGAFRGSDYDVKALLRAILNSETYQRQIRPGEAIDEHLMFAGNYPSRISGDALWNSLTGVLGNMQPAFGKGKAPLKKGPFAGLFQGKGIEAQIKQEFNFDPSTPADEVEGTIPQALLLMNSPQLNQKIRAIGVNMLGRVLSAYPENDDAVRALYLRTLARRPTERELSRCREYVARVGNRNEAFEDLLWVLINSTEFQTRR
jgi:hypothetical protein